jgi:hypothetical protein
MRDWRTLATILIVMAMLYVCSWLYLKDHPL